MSARRTSALIATLGMLLAAGARAQTVTDTSRTAQKLAASREVHPNHLRASHRVDVIAPGEAIESVIDRMRSSKATQSTQGPAQSGQRTTVRGPDQRADGLGPPDGPRGPPNGNNQPPGSGPPPDRPHR